MKPASKKHKEDMETHAEKEQEKKAQLVEEERAKARECQRNCHKRMYAREIAQGERSPGGTKRKVRPNWCL